MATDDLREAMATVREYWGRKFVDPDKYENACELLARWLVANAGELVRVKGLDRGEMWSFLRDVLSQGGDIQIDHATKGYESYSARLDAAARERADQLCSRLAAALEPLFEEGGK